MSSRIVVFLRFAVIAFILIFSTAFFVSSGYECKTSLTLKLTSSFALSASDLMTISNLESSGQLRYDTAEQLRKEVVIATNALNKIHESVQDSSWAGAFWNYSSYGDKILKEKDKLFYIRDILDAIQFKNRH